MSGSNASRQTQMLYKLGIAIAPLLLACVSAWLLMEGVMSLGGGEKDIFLAIPLLFWSLVFLCSYPVLSRRQPVAAIRPIGLSAGIATVAVVVVWLVLFGVSSIGTS